MRFMKAQRVFYKKQQYAEGIVEMVVWQLPKLEPDWPHGHQYRLVFIQDRVRVIGYDNERGKGDHRHYGDREELYRFLDVATLIQDFLNDVRKHR